MGDLKRDEQTYAIIGAAMEVHGELGSGYVESVYAESMEVELNLRKIPWAREVPCPVHYKGVRLKTRFEADVICHGCILPELKVAKALSDAHSAQVINYLKATGLRRGLLFNFGGASLEYKRFILDSPSSPPPSEQPDLSARAIGHATWSPPNL